MQIIKNLAQNEDIILKCKSNIRRCFLLIGEALNNISDGNLFQPLGMKNIGDYAENIHGFKKSTTYGLIKVFQVFGKEIDGNPEYQNINYTRLIEIAPLVTEENKEELLHSAAQIPSAKAFDDVIRELKGKVATDSCTEHDFQPVGLLQCKICGLKVKK